MPRRRHPRRGSMQIWPRKRAKRAYPRIKNWPESEKTTLLGTIGYKAGMTQVVAVDNSKNSMMKGQQVVVPATVIECPPVKVVGMRFYKHEGISKKTVSTLFIEHLDKDFERRAHVKKGGSEPSDFDEVKAIIQTQPKLTGIGKKKPEVLEVAVGGKTKEERVAFVKSLLGKEMKVSDILKVDQQIDVHGVSKGKGFQGVVKRFGIPLLPHKSEKGVRSVGTLGPWHPNKVAFTVAQAGKMGYHTRVEYNKKILLMAEDEKKVNPAGDFITYGKVKNEYLLVKGSVVGPKKRALVLRHAIRPNPKMDTEKYEIVNVSLTSKQGN